MLKEDLSFKDRDKEQLIKFLNLVATKGKFTLDVQEIIEFYKLLSWSQQELLKKIESNVFEIKSVKQASESTKPKQTAKKTK